MLKGARVVLAPLLIQDSDILLGWIRDRDLVVRNGPYLPVGELQHRAWFETIQQRVDTVIFGIRLLDNDELIGSCQLHSIDSVHRSAELQIRIGPVSRRGCGYGSEAIDLLAAFAFDDLNLHRIQLHVFVDNVAAIRVYEKAGFVREGIRREAAYIGGRYVDVLLMAMLAGERMARPSDPSRQRSTPDSS